MESLKAYCGQYIDWNLKADSVVEMLLLADTYHVAELKTECIDFIIENAAAVSATKAWMKQVVSGNQGQLIGEIFGRLSGAYTVNKN